MGTHTYAILQVSPPTYDEIAAKLREAGYDHAFNAEGEIDLHGLALVKAAGFRPATSGTYFRLSRVGAAQGKAIFECDKLLGSEVEVVDAKDYSKLLGVLQGVLALANVKNNSGVNAKTIWAIKALAKAGLK